MQQTWASSKRRIIQNEIQAIQLEGAGISTCFGRKDIAKPKKEGIIEYIGEK